MRTIVESARAMIYNKNLPLFLWAEAVNTAVSILNNTPTSQAPISTPHELWSGKQMSLKHLRTFVSEAYMHVPDQLRKKLVPKGTKMIFVGYDNNSTNYRLFDPVTKKIKISRNVSFNENSSTSEMILQETISITTAAEDQDTASDFENELDAVKSEDLSTTSQDSEDQVIRYNLRPRKNRVLPKHYDVNIAEIPRTYKEAMNSQQSKEWENAIKEELLSLEKNKTWQLVDCPKNKNIIGSIYGCSTSSICPMAKLNASKLACVLKDVHKWRENTTRHSPQLQGTTQYELPLQLLPRRN